MLRRFGFAAAAAVFGLVLVAANAHAISRTTQRCVRGVRLGLKTCQDACRSNLQTAIADCFGPGSACASACQDTLNTCTAPYTTQLRTCNEGCNDTRAAEIAACRDQFGDEAAQDGAAGEEGQRKLDECANAARAKSLKCRLACRDAVDDPIGGCNLDYNECLNTCGSSPNP